MNEQAEVKDQPGKEEVNQSQNTYQVIEKRVETDHSFENVRHSEAFEYNNPIDKAPFRAKKTIDNNEFPREVTFTYVDPRTAPPSIVMSRS